jgi:hypothetical protein
MNVIRPRMRKKLEGLSDSFDRWLHSGMKVQYWFVKLLLNLFVLSYMFYPFFLWGDLHRTFTLPHRPPRGGLVFLHFIWLTPLLFIAFMYYLRSLFKRWDRATRISLLLAILAVAALLGFLAVDEYKACKYDNAFRSREKQFMPYIAEKLDPLWKDYQDKKWSGDTVSESELKGTELKVPFIVVEETDGAGSRGPAHFSLSASFSADDFPVAAVPDDVKGVVVLRFSDGGGSDQNGVYSSSSIYITVLDITKASCEITARGFVSNVDRNEYGAPRSATIAMPPNRAAVEWIRKASEAGLGKIANQKLLSPSN